MERTPAGTSVGVEDPYAHVDRCDHCSDDGRCRFAIERSDVDPAFARDRFAADYRCPVVGDDDQSGLTGRWDWEDCPHFRCRQHDRCCARCGLEEIRLANEDERPLLEEHHLSYATDSTEDDETSHEVTVYLCRWCHSKIHGAWAAVCDDVGPDPEAIAARQGRKARERAELSFDSAAERDRE